MNTIVRKPLFTVTAAMALLLAGWQARQGVQTPGVAFGSGPVPVCTSDSPCPPRPPSR